MKGNLTTKFQKRVGSKQQTSAKADFCDEQLDLIRQFWKNNFLVPVTSLAHNLTTIRY